jgi:hypothetical protein
MTETIDSIVGQVFKNLSETDAGRERVRNMDDLVQRLNGTAPRLLPERARLRARPGMSFSVNTTQAKRGTLKISVRVHGVDCGVVVFEKAGRMFEPSGNFKKQWSSHKKTVDQKALEWGEAAVAEYIEACGCEANSRDYGGRESSIQELLFRAMNEGGTKEILRGFRPVLFGRVPIQIPLPVTPRSRAEKSGKHKGHIDVLARSHGRLVVFEVKRPGAGFKERNGALKQAVRYAAALDYLMSREEHRAAYWQLFGSRRGKDHVPRFSAVAFLDEVGGASEEDLTAELKELLLSNSKGYDLSVMLYRRVSNGIEVVPKIRGKTQQ